MDVSRKFRQVQAGELGDQDLGGRFGAEQRGQDRS
jgi:hypothetical protein